MKADLLGLLGLAALVAAGFVVDVAVGLLVFGLACLFVAWRLP